MARYATVGNGVAGISAAEAIRKGAVKERYLCSQRALTLKASSGR